ncbi:hypothetical protein EYF80_024284 [Liparis tanakae]|uniref:Uncharacterized protein n=1 Tax=Liparis tanakae TaxID=230148 RepID=A0A4Z2HJM7_9TELE|nr:hypothetical protein EYF80_024284 [Liparis tanakae]
MAQCAISPASSSPLSGLSTQRTPEITDTLHFHLKKKAELYGLPVNGDAQSLCGPELGTGSRALLGTATSLGTRNSKEAPAGSSLSTEYT